MRLNTVLVLLNCWHFVNTYKILMALPAPWKSHYQFGFQMAKGLIAKGHHVTLISRFKQPVPMSNFKEILLEYSEEVC